MTTLLSLGDHCLRYIEEYRLEKGQGPSLREVGEKIGTSPTSVQELFKDLSRRGLIIFNTNRAGRMIARSVRLLEE